MKNMKKIYRRTAKQGAKIVFFIGLACIFITCGFFVSRLLSPAPTVVSRGEIQSGFLENSVREISELSTLSHHYTEISFFEDQSALLIFGRELGLPGTARSFILSFSGDIRFGIVGDDIRITFGPDHREGYSSIEVFLPPATILSHTIDIDSIQLLDERTGIFTSFEFEDFTDFIVQQQGYIEQRVSTGQFLEQAQTQAQDAIYALLRAALGDQEHSIRFVQ